MKKLCTVLTLAIALAACNAFPEPREKLKLIKEEETRRKNDSILLEFKKENQQLEKKRDSLKQVLKDTYKSMDSSQKRSNASLPAPISCSINIVRLVHIL
ncbi:hypothetical protein [Paraflavitalea speifideaquila]|uniref:hypothetical protein n=1 Tax=Paraflavitalea speifideaquila TaxID=3076558 RepID=UPI0028EEC783|nr:hypothetical protein [Paraflavitalea speifideiaquila]